MQGGKELGRSAQVPLLKRLGRWTGLSKGFEQLGSGRFGETDYVINDRKRCVGTNYSAAGWSTLPNDFDERSSNLVYSEHICLKVCKGKGKD